MSFLKRAANALTSTVGQASNPRIGNVPTPAEEETVVFSPSSQLKSEFAGYNLMRAARNMPTVPTPTTRLGYQEALDDYKKMKETIHASFLPNDRIVQVQDDSDEDDEVAAPPVDREEFDRLVQRNEPNEIERYLEGRAPNDLNDASGADGSFNLFGDHPARQRASSPIPRIRAVQNNQPAADRAQTPDFQAASSTARPYRPGEFVFVDNDGPDDAHNQSFRSHNSSSTSASSMSTTPAPPQQPAPYVPTGTNGDISKEDAEKHGKAQMTKIEVAPNSLRRAAHSAIMPSRIWAGQKKHEHMGIVGATNSGKTYRFLTFLADQKIPICDRYIIVGDSPKRDEIVKGICALMYLSGRPYQESKIEHFPINEVKRAIALCLDPATLHEEKYVFFNDVLISTADARNSLANFANKAKNFNTTLCIEIHHLAGENMVLMRNALQHKVYCDLSPKSLALELGLKAGDDFITKYAGLAKMDRVVIHERDMGEFNKNYTPF